MKQPADRPILLIIGGANGAGKTTFAREYLTREMKGLRFLNTDEIARTCLPSMWIPWRSRPGGSFWRR